MLPNVIDVAINGTTHHYSLTSLVENRSVREEIGANLSLPTTLTISRNSTGKGNRAVDSYLLRLDMTYATEVDASSNVQSVQTMSAYLVVKVPRGISSGRTNAYYLGMAVRNLMNATFDDSTQQLLNRVLAGEL